MVIINNKYNIIEKLGSGAFGTIFKCQNIRTKELVAVKVEPISLDLKLLKNETKIYNALKGCNGIPTIKWFGKDDVNYYMVLDLLGPSLNQLLLQNSKFSLHDTLQVGIKIVLLLKSIHSKGLIHRDVKPDNFLFKNDELFIIDFGFCKSYLNPDNSHIKLKKLSNMIGSKNYCSISSHKHIELSRRDDLESLGYMLIYFYLGNLTWTNDTNEEIIVSKKQDIHNIVPQVIIDFILYTRNLDFNEEPNYTNIIQLFTKECEK